LPSTRALSIIGFVTLLLVAAFDIPFLGGLVLVLDGLLCMAILVDWSRAAHVPLEVTRRWPPLPVQGARMDVELTLRALANRDVQVALRETLHPSLAERPLRERLTLPSGQMVRFTYTLEPRRRGRPLVGPLVARVRGPWGLAWSQRDVIAEESICIYPQVRWEGQVGRLLALADRRELGRAPIRTMGLGREPYGLREYRPGDPPARIHWKATARHARPISREDSWERGTRLVVLLDCARAMASVDARRSKLDHALAASLALARVAASRGDQITIIAFSDRVERIVRLHQSSTAVAQAYRQLFDLEPRPTEPAFDLAADVVARFAPRRSTVVLLSSVVDLAAAELLSQAALGLARRHRTVLVNLEDPHLADLALREPRDVADAFAKAASLEILLANRRLARRLRRGGLQVATTPAHRLAWETLDAYLGLTRRGAA
jgi:uncharacterized protein (DUF58 family)